MSAKPTAGFSLIEVVLFIVVLGAGFGGLLALYNQITIASVDPVVRKQAVAIATSLLEEIQLRGFTYCDADDPNFYDATSAAECTAGYAESIGPDTTPLPGGAETRYTEPRFDNVNDYDGFSMSGASIRDIAGNAIGGLEGYSASVSVAAAGELTDVANTDALSIIVTVNAPTGVRVVLQGYRLRYAPTTP
jgi:MSHA pilin protein MshD